MTGRGIPAVAALGLLILTAVPSLAQTAPNQAQCATRDKVVGVLAAKYGETRHGIGIAPPDQIMELWANDTTGTWTITITMPNGATCMIGGGQGFKTLTEALPTKGEPA